MAVLKEGSKAPVFKAVDQNGKTISLADFKGKKVILYFYPKDDTPGCTKEACNFRDSNRTMQKRGIVVLGVRWIITYNPQNGSTTNACQGQINFVCLLVY